MSKSTLIAVAAAVLLAAAGCASASPVTLTWTYPRFNAVPGSCVAAGDTLKDLARCELYAQRSGRTDSLLVLTKPCAGLEDRADSTTVDQPKGLTTYWMYVFDFTGNASCRVVTSKLVTGRPLPAVFR